MAVEDAPAAVDDTEAEAELNWLGSVEDAPAAVETLYPDGVTIELDEDVTEALERAAGLEVVETPLEMAVAELDGVDETIAADELEEEARIEELLETIAEPEVVEEPLETLTELEAVDDTPVAVVGATLEEEFKKLAMVEDVPAAVEAL